MSYSAKHWKPAEELNLVPFHPALKVRFRRPMPGTRACKDRSKWREQVAGSLQVYLLLPSAPAPASVFLDGA